MAKKKRVKTAKNEAKKLIGVVVGAVLVFVAIMVTINLFSSNNFDKNVKAISYNSLMEKIENQESFVLFYGATSCSACSSYKPIFAESIEETQEINVYHIDIEKLSKADREAVGTMLGADYTPEVHMFINGVHQTDKLQGYKTKAETVVYLGKFLSLTNSSSGE